MLKLHEPVLENGFQVNKYSFPNPRVNILEHKNLCQRRVAIIFHAQPGLFRINRKIQYTRKKDLQIFGNQTQIVYFIDKFR